MAKFTPTKPILIEIEEINRKYFERIDDIESEERYEERKKHISKEFKKDLILPIYNKYGSIVDNIKIDYYETKT